LDGDERLDSISAPDWPGRSKTFYPRRGGVIPRILNPRNRSLLRGALLVLLSFALSLLLSHFPSIRPNPFLVLPALAATAGTIDHLRCMRTRWSWYHGGVVLLIYMDMMALSMILFFLLYPYAQWLVKSY
jgi:hypothetical protein